MPEFGEVYDPSDCIDRERFDTTVRGVKMNSAHLEACNVSFNDDDATAVAAEIENWHWNGIRACFWHCSLTEKDLRILLGALRQCTNLKEIEFSYIVSPDYWLPAFVEFVNSRKPLEKVILSSNHIKDDDIPILTNESSFIQLDIYRNDLTDAGMATFALWVQKNRSIKALDVSYNPQISLIGYETMTKAAARSWSLEKVMCPTYYTHEALCEACSSAIVYRKCIVLYEKTKKTEGRAITKFIRGDGDNALMHRVISFLLPHYRGLY